MFPTNSYNTPHGYQFGRDAAEFSEDRINPELWDEALSERSFEETNDEPVYPIEAEHERIQAAAADSMAVVTSITEQTERQNAAEHSAFVTRAKGYGRWIEYDRDWEQAA